MKWYKGPTKETYFAVKHTGWVKTVVCISWDDTVYPDEVTRRREENERKSEGLRRSLGARREGEKEIRIATRRGGGRAEKAPDCAGGQVCANGVRWLERMTLVTLVTARCLILCHYSWTLTEERGLLMFRAE